MAFRIAQDRKEIDDKVTTGMVEQEEEMFPKVRKKVGLSFQKNRLEKIRLLCHLRKKKS